MITRRSHILKQTWSWTPRTISESTKFERESLLPWKTNNSVKNSPQASILCKRSNKEIQKRLSKPKIIETNSIILLPQKLKTNGQNKCDYNNLRSVASSKKPQKPKSYNRKHSRRNKLIEKWSCFFQKDHLTPAQYFHHRNLHYWKHCMTMTITKLIQ